MRKFLLGAGLIFWVGLSQAQNDWKTTEHGFRFKNHTNKTGVKPKIGESALFYVDIFAGTVLLNSSKTNQGGVYQFDLFSPEENETGYFPPMHDAALLMSVGDSATIYQAVDSFMRKFLPPQAATEKEIRFELVLREVVTAEAKAKAAAAAKEVAERIKSKVQNTLQSYKAGLLNKQVTLQASGLKMYVEEPGSGEKIKQGEAVQVHYYGMLQADGKPFDNSFERREPLGFPAGVGQMIQGFDEGVMTLRHGARAYLFIPYQLGYGETDAAGGLIPAKSDLLFYIEIL